MVKHFEGISYFLKLCWKYSKLYVVCLFSREILSIVTTIFLIVAPRYLLDELFGGRDINTIIYYTVIVVGVPFVLNQVIHLLSYKADNLKEEVYINFETDFSKSHMEGDYVQLENPEYYNKRILANNFINGQWNQFGKILDIALSIFRNIGIVIGIMYIMSSLNIFILIIFVGLAFVNVKVNSKLKTKRMKLISEFSPIIRRRAYFENVTTNIDYAKEIRIGGLHDWIIKKYKSYMDIFCGKTSEIYGLDVVSKNTYTVTNIIQQIITYSYLVYTVVKYNYTLGQFTMYFNAINIFNNTINEIINSLIEISQFNSYYEAFREYNDIENTDRIGNKSFDVDKKDNVFMEFENVSFKYQGQNNYALENINVKILGNEKISIVGENGAGKTTFVKLMTRLYKPSTGRILLNGTDINEYDYDAYMKLFSVVFQDYKLFEISLKENIVLDDERSSEERLEYAIEKSGLEEKVKALDKGVYTQIGKMFDETGIEPSGGESQKIAIARALYKNGSIAILDEPTAALDPRAEYEIYKNFNNLTDNKTAVYISHRLSSTKFCDRILVFDRGRIVETGSHEELLELNNLYAELFSMQAEFYL